MKLQPLLLALLGTLLALTLACSGGSGYRAPTPSHDAPHNVIAFGASDGLYLIDPDGAHLRRLYQEAAPVSFPAWSPDGARIAYVVGGAGGPATLRIYDFATKGTVAVSDQAFVGSFGAPAAWASDGNRLAFVDGSSTAHRLRVYDVAKHTMLQTADVPAEAVAWASTSGSITVVSSGDTVQLSRIVNVRPDGTNARVLQEGALEGDPRWSPEGTRLAFWSSASPQLVQHTVQVSSGGSGRPVDVGPGIDAAWAPNAKRIAFSRPADVTPGAAFDIYMVDAAGGEPAIVAHSTALDRWPAWSPGAAAIVFLAQVDQSTAFVCVVTLATNKSACLDTTGLLPTQPVWSPF